MSIKKQKYYAIIAFLIFSILTIYITFPLVFNLGSISTGLGDELLIAWIHNWVIHSLMSGNILSLFNANIYYPFDLSLAFSDLFITSSVISIIPLLIYKEPIVVVNFTLISSLLMLGFSIYILSFYLTRHFLVSIFSGILVIFSPAVLDKAVHIQILSVQWIPISVLFFLVFLRKQKSKFLIISLLFLIIQTYNSFLPGYFIIFLYFIFFIFNLIYKKEKTIKLLTKKNFLILFTSFIIILPITIPYFQVSQRFSYTRDIRDAIHLALHPEDFLYTNEYSRLSPFLNNLPFNKASQNNEFKAGFIGLLFSALAILSLAHFLRNYKRSSIEVKAFSLTGLVGLILSLGPFMHLSRHTVHDPFPIPLPYALFYYIIPGFQGFRNSARWEILFVLCMAIVIAIFLKEKISKFSPIKQRIILFLLILFPIMEFNFPMKFVDVPQKKDWPKIYNWINKNTPKDSRIIELPIYTWNMQPYVFDENLREYYSTIHFRKMINGASGYSPEPWQKLVISIMNDFPSSNVIAELKKLKINYIILNKNEYDRLNIDKFNLNNKRVETGDKIVSILKKNNNLQLIKIIENDYVYQIK